MKQVVSGEESKATSGKWLELLFYVGLTLLVGHELDAVRNGEWRFLPGLSQFTDNIAYPAFLIMQIPLIATFLWSSTSTFSTLRVKARYWIDVFLILHLGLHVWFADHRFYLFDSLLSEIFIYGSGLVGVAHLVLSLFGAWQRR